MKEKSLNVILQIQTKENLNHDSNTRRHISNVKTKYWIQ